MKKHIILAAVAALATLTACSNDEEEEPKVPGAEVTFSINGPVTRATTDVNSNITTFENNDKVGIFSKGLYIDLTGQIFTVNQGKLDDTNNTNPRFNANKPASFYAFYPAATVESGATIKTEGTSITVTVSEDQSSTTAFDKNDFMVATCENQTSASPNIEFKFNHKLSLIKVDVSTFEENITINAVQIEGVKTSSTWNYSASSLTPSGETKIVKMGNPSAEKTTEFWAIIPAQTYSNVTFQLTTSENKLYTYTLASGTFDEGKIYSYTMKMNLTSMSATVAMENQWGTGDSEDNATTDRKLRTIIQATGDVNTAVTLSGSNWNTVSTGWGYCNSSATITNNGDGWFKLVINNINWYSSSLTYRTDNFTSNISGKYQLSFSAKGINTNTKNTLKVMVLTPYETSASGINNNNCYFQLQGAYTSTGYITPNLSTDDSDNDGIYNETEVKISLDLTKWKGSQSPYKDNEYDSDADTFSNGIIITIGGGENTNETFYIKNLSIEEVE